VKNCPVRLLMILISASRRGAFMRNRREPRFVSRPCSRKLRLWTNALPTLKSKSQAREAPGTMRGC
jgi:hypothetical protein